MHHRHAGFSQSSWPTQLYTCQREVQVNLAGRGARLPARGQPERPRPRPSSRWGRAERSPCPHLLPSQLRQIERSVSKPGTGPATSVGIPPAHSILPWRPALFGQVTLTQCSTMLLHTPGLLLCYENKTMHAKEKKLG